MLQAAWIGWYRQNAQALAAMADRLTQEAEHTAALHARNESGRQAALADRLEGLDSRV